MAKRTADWSPMAPGVCGKALSARGLFHMPPPAPGSIPDETMPLSADDLVFVEDLCIDDGFPPLARSGAAGHCKRMKAWHELCPRSPPLPGDDSQASTAASTPTATPASSPRLRAAAAAEPRCDVAPGADYGSLSVQELREELGVDGTELAAGWDRLELVGVLEYLDHMCLCDPDDPIGMEL